MLFLNLPRLLPVGGSRSDFFDHLINIEPEVLLRCDVTRRSDADKLRLVEGLLQRTKRGEHFEKSGGKMFYSALAHQDLGAQLRPYILDETLNIVVRWLALDSANAP